MAGQLPPGFQIDPALSAQMGGTIAINPTTGKKIRWRESAGAGGAPEGATPRPEFGAGAYETPDGMILKSGKGGGTQVLRGAQTAGAEARTRLQLGLGPTVEAQKNLFAEERWNQDMSSPEGRLGSNPHDSFRGVVGNLLAPDNPEDSIRTRLSKQAGGPRYQRYVQAAKTFESAFMPILSGAAVSPSEAQRLLKASLPEAGDNPEILARKSKNRAMMINGAAKLLGEKPPFPRIPAMDLTPFVEGGREPAVEASIVGKPEAGVGRSYATPTGGAAKPIVIDIDGNPL